jgi:hypothetical protein
MHQPLIMWWISSLISSGSSIAPTRDRVRARVAEVGGDRVVAVASLALAQPVGGHVERLVPADLLPLGAEPAHRPPE